MPNSSLGQYSIPWQGVIRAGRNGLSAGEGPQSFQGLGQRNGGFEGLVRLLAATQSDRPPDTGRPCGPGGGERAWRATRARFARERIGAGQSLIELFGQQPGLRIAFQVQADVETC